MRAGGRRNYVEPYSLTELSQHLELDSKVVKQSKVSADEAYHEGRNHRIFTELKGWGYVVVREYRGEDIPTVATIVHRLLYATQQRSCASVGLW